MLLTADIGNTNIVLALLDHWTDEIAQGLAGMVHIFNPQLILIGGGVSAQQKLLIEPIAAKVKASVMPAFAEGLEVPGCTYIDKPTFGWTHWNERSFDEIELIGLCTDICVVSNALPAPPAIKPAKISKKNTATGSIRLLMYVMVVQKRSITAPSLISIVMMPDSQTESIENY